MRLLRSHALAAAAVYRRDLLVYVSYRGRMLTQLFSIFVSLAMFYYISRLVKVHEFRTAERYFSYVVVGIVIAETLQAAAAVGMNLHAELLTGAFERIVCSPYGAVNGIASSVIFPIQVQLIVATLTVCAGSLVFGLHVEWSTASLALPIALLGAALFSTVALLGAAAMLVAKQTSVLTAYATIALGLLGGVYFPISLLPAWGQFVAQVQPLTYLVELIRHVLIGYPLHESWLTAMVHIVGFLIVLAPLAYIALTQAVRLTRRRATLLEY